MSDVILLFQPRWIPFDIEWKMIVGGTAVARLVPNFHPRPPDYDWMPPVNPEFRWLSLIDIRRFRSHGWNGVPFLYLDVAMFDIEQWWHHMCRGEAFQRSAKIGGEP